MSTSLLEERGSYLRNYRCVLRIIVGIYIENVARCAHDRAVILADFQGLLEGIIGSWGGRVRAVSEVSMHK